MNFHNLKKISFERNDKNFRIFNIFIFIISLFLHFLKNLLFKSPNWFFAFYFSDLLASIVLFSFLNALFPVKLTNIYLLLFITAIASFVWEYIALFIKNGAVFDLNDVVCYFISCLIYIVLIKIYSYFLNKSLIKS